MIVSHGEFDSGEDMLIFDLEQIPPPRNKGLNNVDTARNGTNILPFTVHDSSNNI